MTKDARRKETTPLPKNWRNRMPMRTIYRSRRRKKSSFIWTTIMKRGATRTTPLKASLMKVFDSQAQADGSLLHSKPFSYLYSEWDFRIAGYRSRWCRVRERVMVEGTSDFYTETLTEHRPLVAQVTGRFEHYLPELFRKVTRRLTARICISTA